MKQNQVIHNHCQPITINHIMPCFQTITSERHRICYLYAYYLLELIHLLKLESKKENNLPAMVTKPTSTGFLGMALPIRYDNTQGIPRASIPSYSIGLPEKLTSIILQVHRVPKGCFCQNITYYNRTYIPLLAPIVHEHNSLTSQRVASLSRHCE